MATKAAPKVIVVGLAAVLAAAGTLIAKWEGVRYMPYLDAVGVLTVCYGHTGPDIVPGKAYTADECKALLDADMLVANASVRRCLPMPLLRQVEVALTSLVFNVGPRAVCGSTLQRRALANDWPGACAAIDMWKYAAGRVMRGLVLRRANERGICEGSIAL
jgi:lysozyme